jgi:hypothetical protein
MNALTYIMAFKNGRGGNPYSSAFRTRVELDGGTLESFNCLNVSLQHNYKKMSYFEDASLVLIPSAVKISKAYSIKPTDGTGDLTFTRTADTATRVASNGLIERVRTNLLTYSNDFSNAAWTKVRATLTGGQSDPFGGTDAWKRNGRHRHRLHRHYYGSGIGWASC